MLQEQRSAQCVAATVAVAVAVDVGVAVAVRRRERRSVSAVTIGVRRRFLVTRPGGIGGREQRILGVGVLSVGRMLRKGRRRVDRRLGVGVRERVEEAVEQLRLGRRGRLAVGHTALVLVLVKQLVNSEAGATCLDVAQVGPVVRTVGQQTDAVAQ